MAHRRTAMTILAALSWLSVSGLAVAETADHGVTAASAEKCDRARFGMVVDVGHTVEAPGALSARNVYEYEFNRRLAALIEQDLVAAGFDQTTLLITGGAARPSLGTRVAAANKTSADLFLSIHHDSVPDSFLENWDYQGTPSHYSDRFRGHSIFVSTENPHFDASLAFARLLGRQLKDRGLQYTPHYTQAFMGRHQHELLDADVGVYRYDQLVVLRSTQMPAVLLEAGSIINRDEELELATPERQALTSAAVTDAVTAFCAARAPRARVARPADAGKPPASASVLAPLLKLFKR